MKNIFKSLLVLATAATLATGCIKETFPQEDVTTSEQLARSSAGLTGAVSGMAAQLYQRYYFFGSSNQLEADFSYAAVKLGLARTLCDLCGHGNEGYDWFFAYTGRYGKWMSYENDDPRVVYMTLYKIIKSANDIISIINTKEDKSDLDKQYLGVAYAFRANMYYDLFTMYLPAELDEGVSASYKIDESIKNLTVPIVVTSAEKQPVYGSARAPKEDLIALIKADLDKAEENLSVSSPVTGSRTPSLAVVYGLKARMHLALGEWEDASHYAQLAITTSGKVPMNSEQIHNPNTAFAKHDASDSWMWYYSIPAEIMGNLCNTPGFIAGEAAFGYNKHTKLSVHKWIYDKINYTDIRKTWFIDPDKTKYPVNTYKWTSVKSSNGLTFLETYPFEDDNAVPPYQMFKFRCKDGAWSQYKDGGSVDFPLMRVEEMYLIDAEAQGMLNGGNDGSALEAFIKTYRDPEYNYASRASGFGSDGFVHNFQEECFFQKRLEFIGEGVGFYDAKRIRVGLRTSYPGSNQIYEKQCYNYSGVSPFWNFVIPIDEIEANNLIINEGTPQLVDGIMQTLNNPDPTQSLANN